MTVLVHRIQQLGVQPHQELCVGLSALGPDMDLELDPGVVCIWPHVPFMDTQDSGQLSSLRAQAEHTTFQEPFDRVDFVLASFGDFIKCGAHVLDEPGLERAKIPLPAHRKAPNEPGEVQLIAVKITGGGVAFDEIEATLAYLGPLEVQGSPQNAFNPLFGKLAVFELPIKYSGCCALIGSQASSSRFFSASYRSFMRSEAQISIPLLWQAFTMRFGARPDEQQTS